MEKLKQYIIALTNLYGQVPASKVAEIYSSQNEDEISIKDVESYFNEDLSRDYVYAYKEHFVHETIMEFKDFKSMLQKKADKPYYIPEKEELLKYSDMKYYEKPIQYHNLIQYVKNNFFANDSEKAESLCENILWKCKDDFKPQEAFELFNVFGVNFKDMNQVNEVLKFIMDLSNNIRLWENNGHTPDEIFNLLEKPNLRPLPDKPFNIGGSSKKEKIGRNDPCPCGSGKKYKKCCLGKEK